jgi:glucan biosynthesis protein C
MNLLPPPNAGPLQTAECPAAKNHFAGLETVRASAALIVVLLHSGVPYLVHPMPGLIWPVRDTASSLIDFGFWSIELFIMPLFLMIAGFLAWRTLHRRGPQALIRSRARRLLLPLAFGMVFILPLDLYAWVLGWVAEGVVAPVKLRSLKFSGEIGRDLWGLSHLWFLQYLFMYVAVLAIFDSLRSRSEILRRVHFSPALVTALVLVIGSATLFVRPEVVWGFQHAFLPVPSKWIYSGLFFSFGVALAAHNSLRFDLQANVGRLAMPTILLTVAAVTLGRWYLRDGEGQLASFTLAILTCGGALLISVTILGIAIKRTQRVSPLISYLAAASFWIYIVHHPILGLVHLDLKWMFPDVSPVVKTFATFTITSGVSLLTYEGLVRRTALNRWLGFPPISASTPSVDGGRTSLSVVGDRRARPVKSLQDLPQDPRKAA